MCRKNLVWSSGGDVALPPDRRHGELPHAHPLRERVERSVPDDPQHLRRGGVVRPRDHRVQEGTVTPIQGPVGHGPTIEICGHQHWLKDAGRPLDVVWSIAIEVLVGPHGKGDIAGATVGVPDRGSHVGAPHLVQGPVDTRDQTRPRRRIAMSGAPGHGRQSDQADRRRKQRPPAHGPDTEHAHSFPRSRGSGGSGRWPTPPGERSCLVRHPTGVIEGSS